MRTNLFFLVLSMLIIACDDRLDFVNDFNSPPSIFIVKNGNDYTESDDSVKTSIKSQRDYLEVTIRASDPEGFLSRISVQLIDGNGTFEQNNTTITSNLTFDENGVATFIFKPLVNRSHRFRVTAYDNLNKTSEVTVRVLSFENLTPIAVRNITAYRVNHPLEYILDGSQSKDPDINQGGGIIQYEWNINGNKFTSPSSLSYFVFPNPGTYDIKLRVRDNDGTFSPWVGGVLSIN